MLEFHFAIAATAAGKPHKLADTTGKNWYDRIQSGDGVDVGLEINGQFSRGQFPEALSYAPNTAAYKSVWQDIIDKAEEYNDPGEFTTLIGFEWTSLVTGNRVAGGFSPPAPTAPRMRVRTGRFLRI